MDSSNNRFPISFATAVSTEWGANDTLELVLSNLPNHTEVSALFGVDIYRDNDDLYNPNSTDVDSASGELIGDDLNVTPATVRNADDTYVYPQFTEGYAEFDLEIGHQANEVKLVFAAQIDPATDDRWQPVVGVIQAKAAEVYLELTGAGTITAHGSPSETTLRMTRYDNGIQDLKVPMYLSGAVAGVDYSTTLGTNNVLTITAGQTTADFDVEALVRANPDWLKALDIDTLWNKVIKLNDHPERVKIAADPLQINPQTSTLKKNDNDNDGIVGVDKDRLGALTQADPDLVKVDLVGLKADAVWEYTLKAGASFRIWSDSEKTTLLADTSGTATFRADALPTSVWLEAVSVPPNGQSTLEFRAWQRLPGAGVEEPMEVVSFESYSFFIINQ